MPVTSPGVRITRFPVPTRNKPPATSCSANERRPPIIGRRRQKVLDYGSFRQGECILWHPNMIFITLLALGATCGTARICSKYRTRVPPLPGHGAFPSASREMAEGGAHRPGCESSRATGTAESDPNEQPAACQPSRSIKFSISMGASHGCRRAAVGQDQPSAAGRICPHQAKRRVAADRPEAWQIGVRTRSNVIWVGLGSPLLDHAEGVAVSIGQNDVICVGGVAPFNTAGAESQQAFDFSGRVFGIKVEMMALVILGLRCHRRDRKLRATASARHEDRPVYTRLPQRFVVQRRRPELDGAGHVADAPND